MFNRSETSRIKQEFWTAFGKYMSPIPSSEGMKINWVNYRTGVKGVFFRMETLPDRGIISISIEQPDPGIRELFFQQFEELKEMLHTTLEEEWTWNKDTSIIYRELPNASVLNKDHWPDLISFFKPRIIALDAFWENGRYAFEGLT
jgi:hypothetical protein